MCIYIYIYKTSVSVLLIAKFTARFLLPSTPSRNNCKQSEEQGDNKRVVVAIVSFSLSTYQRNLFFFSVKIALILNVTVFVRALSRCGVHHIDFVDLTRAKRSVLSLPDHMLARLKAQQKA